MTQVAHPIPTRGLTALLSSNGTKVTPDENGYCHLGANLTYYFPFAGPDSTQQAVQFAADAIAAGTVTLQGTNLPKGTADVPDITDWDETAGNWLLYNPTTTVLVATGSVATAATVVVTAGQATGALWVLPNIGIKRMRMKFATTAASIVRVLDHGKY